MNTADMTTQSAVSASVTPTDARERLARGRANVHPQAARKHGGHSAALLAPIRERHLAWLQERFPTADVAILSLQASRLAQLELVGEWLDDRGIMRNKRLGTTYPAADFWSKVASAFERQHERLEEAQRSSPFDALSVLDQEGDDAH